MSKPKRYTAAGSGVVRTDPEGDLVLYVDYLRLLIEVDELKSQPDPLTAYLYAAELAKDDIKRLKAEVERLTLLQAETLAERNKAEAQVRRLTKAGDDMAEAIDEHRHGKGGAWGIGFLVREHWKTAKEGKPHA